MAHDIDGRHDRTVGIQIVGDVEQRVDQHLVGADAGLHRGLARRIERKLLRIKPAFRTDRHDDGILHLLRLHQAEDLGTEILAPVRPADAAARHLAEA